MIITDTRSSSRHRTPHLAPQSELKHRFCISFTWRKNNNVRVFKRHESGSQTLSCVWRAISDDSAGGFTDTWVKAEAGDKQRQAGAWEGEYSVARRICWVRRERVRLEQQLKYCSHRWEFWNIYSIFDEVNYAWVYLLLARKNRSRTCSPERRVFLFHHLTSNMTEVNLQHSLVNALIWWNEITHVPSQHDF